MASTIDDRIVSMKFDNGAFESKLSATISSLDKLRGSLDFSNAKRGLEDLSNAGKNFNLNGISTSIEGVSSKFLSLATIGVTALATITTKAISAAAEVAKAFTISPILDGFHEYETQLNSVQTILANTASKGTSLEEVNAALQKLNTYSDQTIYNFGEMAKNIGTFTAAGVDLDTSVSSIKGIANIAAMSGSSSEQASTAMYQLSQAIAAGSLKLMDWNSVVNAGMGGEAFKSALFETGKAMGKLNSVPLKQTFTQWEDAGHSFRESLQDGWITADVLTTTLSAFTGDMTEEMLIAKGFSQDQATSIIKTANIAKAAATEVKTFSQLMGTVKEAVGTGWADSFGIIVGNFTEAKKLWTAVNTEIGGFISKNADARNALLKGWKDFGGRAALLTGLKDSFYGILSVIKPITQAFRDIFPKTTVEQLLKMTAAFAEFAKRIKIGEETATKLKETFRGLFALVDIGWEIIKGLATVIKSLFSALSPVGSSFLDLTARIGEFLYNLHQVLIEGGALSDFFISVAEIAKYPIDMLIQLKDAVADFFSPDVASDAVESGLGRVGDRVDNLKGVADKVSEAWGRMEERFKGVVTVLDTVWGYIRTWFSELGSKIASAFSSGDFDTALDVINVGLLGGIVVLLKKFLKGGLKIDFGGDIIEKIKKALDGVTGTLKAMQTNLKAEALMKIAGAMAILTASIVVLSLIDSAALTKALTAITVGFAQLIGTMTLMDKIVGSAGAAAKLALVGVAMIILAVAIGILTLAIRNLSGLDTVELATGLGGVAVGVGLLVAAFKLIDADKTGMASAGFALMGMAAGLLVLSVAVKAFANMSWADMAKGMVGIALGLGLMTVAMKFMPNASIFQKGGFAVVAYSLKILAEAVAKFGELDWSVMFKGLVGIAGALLVIAGAMSLMPKDMLITGPALIAVGLALQMLAIAVRMMGDMDLGVIGKGIIGFLAILLILSAAMEAMQGTVGGALALIVIASAMVILMGVITTLGMMDISTIVQGLVALAATIAVLGIAALLMEPVLPALLGLGIALGIVGIAIALFGLGAMLLAKSFEIMAASGVAGAKSFVEAIDVMLGAIPKIAAGFALIFVKTAEEFLKALPQLIEVIAKVLGALLDAIIKLTPKIAEAFISLVKAGLMALREIYPDLVATGMFLIMSLLQGIRDNIYQIVTIAVEIIVNFVKGLTANIGMIVQAAVDLVIAFVTAISSHTGEFLTAGLSILLNLLQGIADNIFMVVDAVVNLVLAFLSALANAYSQIVQAGASILMALLQGIADTILTVVDTVANIVMQFIGALASKALEIANAGTMMLLQLLAGIANNMIAVVNMVGDIVIAFIGAFGDKATSIATAGVDTLIRFLNGIEGDIWRVTQKGVDVIITFLAAMSSSAVDFVNRAADVLIAFLDGLAEAVRTHSKQIEDSVYNLAGAIIDGIIKGFMHFPNAIKDKLLEIVGDAWDSVLSFFGVDSPSKLAAELGGYVVQGLVVGLSDKSDTVGKGMTKLGETAVSSFQDTMSKISTSLSNIDEFSPVITPVLDLTKVEASSKNLEQYMRISPITPEVSIDNARFVASTAQATGEAAAPPVYSGPTEVTFEQNIYAPTELSTNDIYRNTKSQIVLAREALGIK